MYKNLILSGGGVLGLSYIGTLEVLHTRDTLKDFKNFGGTSIGSVFAAMLACDADYYFIKDNLATMDFHTFKDNSINCIQNLYRVITKYGYYKGDLATAWIKDILKKLTGSAEITFAEVWKKYGHELVIVGTSLKKKRAVYFNRFDYPDMPIATAVRISISIPMYFKAVEWDNDIWVDGGICDNFPISYFDSPEIKRISDTKNENSKFDTVDDMLEYIQCLCDSHVAGLNETLGILPLSASEYNNTESPVTNLSQYTAAIVQTVLKGDPTGPVNPFNASRTVRVDCDQYSSLDFNIDTQSKLDLIVRGRNAMSLFLDSPKTRKIHHRSVSQLTIDHDYGCETESE